MSCVAVYSLVWLRGWKLMSAGGFAVNVNGPEIVSRSWVPIATRLLFLHKKNCYQLTVFSMLHIYNPNICTSDLQMFWWSFSCSSMKLSYRSCVKVMFLNTAATAYGLTAAVCAKQTQTFVLQPIESSICLTLNDDTTCLLGNNQSLRNAADWADTFVTGCLQSAVETQS